MLISINWRTTNVSHSASALCGDLSMKIGVAMTPQRSTGLNGSTYLNDRNSVVMPASSLNQTFGEVANNGATVWQKALLAASELRGMGIESYIKVDDKDPLYYAAELAGRLEYLSSDVKKASEGLKSLRTLWPNKRLKDIRLFLERALEHAK